MNKSIEFINNQIITSKVADAFPHENWTENNKDIAVLNFFEILKSVLTKKDYDNTFKKNKMSIVAIDTNTKDSREIQAKYDADVEYQYFLSQSTIIPSSDEKVSIDNIVFEICGMFFRDLATGATYYVDKVPKNYVENYMNYNLKYTIGDLLLKAEEESEYTIEKKPENTAEKSEETNEDKQIETIKGRLLTVVLPVAIKYSKKKVNTEDEKNGEQKK